MSLQKKWQPYLKRKKTKQKPQSKQHPSLKRT